MNQFADNNWRERYLDVQVEAAKRFASELARIFDEEAFKKFYLSAPHEPQELPGRGDGIAPRGATL